MPEVTRYRVWIQRWSENDIGEQRNGPKIHYGEYAEEKHAEAVSNRLRRHDDRSGVWSGYAACKVEAAPTYRDEDINQRIRWRLSGDNSRVRQKCKKCDGIGEVPCVEFADGPGTAYQSGEPCPDCTGGGWIYHQHRLATAIMQWTWTLGDKELEEGWPVIYDHKACLWSNRVGQPWQASIEKYVLGEPCPCSATQIEVLGTQVNCDPSICGNCCGSGMIGGYIASAPVYQDDFELLASLVHLRGWRTVVVFDESGFVTVTLKDSVTDTLLAPPVVSDKPGSALFELVVDVLSDEPGFLIRADKEN